MKTIKKILLLSVFTILYSFNSSAQCPANGYWSINGLTVNFYNTSSSFSSSSWDFGDGNTSNATNPIHTYAAPGSYYVTLEIGYYSQTLYGPFLYYCTVGGTLTVTDPANIYGCTDSTATNYDPSATVNDGYCTYPCFLDAVTLNLYDSYGDGWNGNSLTVDGLDYTFTTGSSSSFDLCVDLAVCNTTTFNATGSWISECSWDIVDASGVVIASGADNSVDFGACGTNLFGCTDATASNYDAGANTDDGSCTYTTCNKPTGLNTYDITDTRFRLGWDNMNTSSCMVLKYNLRYRVAATATSSAGSWTTKSAGAGNGQCNFELNNVEKLMINFTPSTTYDLRLRVQYCESMEWSEWTSSIQVTTAGLCPDLVNMTVTTFNNQQNKARFDWDTTGVYMFARLYTRVNGGNAPYNWTIQGGFGIDYPIFSKNIFTFTPGETYRVQANSFCSATMTSYKGNLTPPVIWTQPGGSAKISNGTAINNLDVYPNPSRDVFNITFTNEEVQDLKVRILNIVGEELVSEDLQQFVGEYTKQINLSNNAKGIYFLEIATNNGVINKKLILQ